MAQRQQKTTDTGQQAKHNMQVRHQNTCKENTTRTVDRKKVDIEKKQRQHSNLSPLSLDYITKFKAHNTN